LRDLVSVTGQPSNGSYVRLRLKVCRVRKVGIGKKLLIIFIGVAQKALRLWCEGPSKNKKEDSRKVCNKRCEITEEGLKLRQKIIRNYNTETKFIDMKCSPIYITRIPLMTSMEELGIDRKILLNLVLKRKRRKVSSRLVWFKIGTTAGCCKHGNETFIFD
jgi:hypothetical protein